MLTVTIQRLVNIVQFWEEKRNLEKIHLNFLNLQITPNNHYGAIGMAIRLSKNTNLYLIGAIFFNFGAENTTTGVKL